MGMVFPGVYCIVLPTNFEAVDCMDGREKVLQQTAVRNRDSRLSPQFTEKLKRVVRGIERPKVVCKGSVLFSTSGRVDGQCARTM